MSPDSAVLKPTEGIVGGDGLACSFDCPTERIDGACADRLDSA
jgi:hypothetical protein